MEWAWLTVPRAIGAKSPVPPNIIGFIGNLLPRIFELPPGSLRYVFLY